EVSMRPLIVLITFILTAMPCAAQDRVILVIHGGAGAISRKSMTPEREKKHLDTLERALKAGRVAIAKGSSLDGVEAAINVMEDSAISKPGRGAVFNRDGRQELNASIMDGKTKNAGAVAGISRLKNPISAARLIMEKSEHVFMIGDGCERFCRDQGMEL